RDDVYWAGRSTLVSRPEDLRVYDAAFAIFWQRTIDLIAPPEPAPPDRDGDEPTTIETLEVGVAPEALSEQAGLEASDADEGKRDGEPDRALASQIEVLRAKDFSEYESEEYLLARRLMARLQM